jgi:hypothetical protein
MASGDKVFTISGASGQGLQDVLRALMAAIAADRAPAEQDAPAWRP